MCGDWHNIQEHSTRTWYSIIPVGVKRGVESVKCVMGDRTQEKCSLSLKY
jgi:hypothetical protein